MSCFRPIKGCCHKVHLLRGVPQKVKGVKMYDCNHISLYENIPARIGESRSIEENRLQDILPYPSNGDKKNAEYTVMLCPSFPLSNFKAGDFVCVPYGNRPNNASPVQNLPGVGPNIWINTPDGPELLTWTCMPDGTWSFQGAVQIYQNEDGVWCMAYEDQEHCFSNSNFMCSQFPEGYSFVQSTGPDAHFTVLKIDRKEDHNCHLSHYSVFMELRDQEGICIQ